MNVLLIMETAVMIVLTNLVHICVLVIVDTVLILMVTVALVIINYSKLNNFSS